LYRANVTQPIKTAAKPDQNEFTEVLPHINAHIKQMIAIIHHVGKNIQAIDKIRIIRKSITRWLFDFD
jgi:hypothetical protein